MDEPCQRIPGCGTCIACKDVEVTYVPEPKSMRRVLAVDGDILAYRTAAVCEDHFEGAATSILDSTLRDISTDTGIHEMRIYVSGEFNFRYKVAKTKPYKGNRATMVRPRLLDFCKQYLVERYGAIVVDGFEADDAIATDMTVNGAVHCGIDKDMLQVAGDHYNYVKKEWKEINEGDAELILWRQVLMGDASDNVPGLPRVGEKTAEAKIQSQTTAQMDAMDFYEEVCSQKMPDVNHVEYMAEQYNLIYMVRDVPLYAIDFDLSVRVEPNTEGFAQQKGDFEDASSPFAKAAVRL